ncbi:MAG: hypothetical protein IJS03_02125 [Eubacterium sp.]|nr:hypothetical protein [Eubacterium sp.]
MSIKNKRTVIIILLIIAIGAACAVWGASLISKQNSQNPQPTESTTQSEEISYDDLDALLSNQPMCVNGVQYFYKGGEKKLDYDAMGATVLNNSDVKIKSFVIAFCAFDVDGKPIKIKQPTDKNDGAYIRTVSYDMIKMNKNSLLEPQQTFDNIIFYVNDEPQIVTIKACIKGYESSDKVTWTNPYYETFKQLYAGQTLKTETESQSSVSQSAPAT